MTNIKYKAKTVGIDCVQMDERGEFEIILKISDIPQQQLDIWKERLFKNVEIEIDSDNEGE